MLCVEIFRILYLSQGSLFEGFQVSINERQTQAFTQRCRVRSIYDGLWHDRAVYLLAMGIMKQATIHNLQHNFFQVSTTQTMQNENNNSAYAHPPYDGTVTPPDNVWQSGNSICYGSRRCVQIIAGERCTGFAYTPSGLCVDCSPVCADCGFGWPNCECDNF